MGSKRIVVNFGAGDDRYFVIQKLGELADDAALGLSSEAQQNNVVPRENGVDELGDNCFVVTDDAAKKFLAARKFLYQICAQFVFD